MHTQLPSNLRRNFLTFKPYGKCLVAFVAIGLFGNPIAASAAILVNYNFNGLSTGTLGTQDGWSTLATRVSPSVVAGPVGSLNTSNTLSNSSSVGTALAKKDFFATNSLSSASVITLSASFYSGAISSIEVFGVGASTYAGNTAPSAQFGIFNGQFWLRGENFGTISTPLNSSNSPITAAVGSWYEIQSIWDLGANGGAGSATFAVKNLTLGETAFTNLYFDQAQTQTTASLGLTTNPNTWTTGYVRVGGYGVGAGYIDNLNVVPEPASLALCAIGIGGILLIRRKRRVS